MAGGAINHVSKLLRSNAVTASATAVVSCGPDFYRAAIDKSISWRQFTKNSAVNAAGAAGGWGGWVGGAAAGAAVGSAIPIVGTAVGGFVGGVIGALSLGAVTSGVTKSIADELVEDDDDFLGRVLQAERDADLVKLDAAFAKLEADLDAAFTKLALD